MRDRNRPAPDPAEILTVLAVGDVRNEIEELRQIFRRSNWVMLEVRDAQEAITLLRKMPIGVVVCQACRNHSGWKDLLQELSNLPKPPHLIVSSWDADEALWAEVLNLGGYDVLARPYDPREVVRVLSLAWLNWKTSCSPRVLASATA